MKKHSITFSSDKLSLNSVYFGSITDNVKEGIAFVLSEAKAQKSISSVLIENRIFEIIVSLIRLSGYEEATLTEQEQSPDERVALAKSFILDNIGESLSVSDVSSYVHLSAKQLSRLFVRYEGISLAKYITGVRMKKIGDAVAEGNASFKEISEAFSYNNEYYFSTAFKAYFGISPSDWRKMNKK